MIRLIAELGSCHMGKIERIREAIDRCKASGIDALKLQLFPNEAPYVPTNIYLPPEMFIDAFTYGLEKGVDVSASCFDRASFDFLMNCRPKFIKFAYSKKTMAEEINITLGSEIETIVSCDVMTDHLVHDNATKLYCIPEYPVRYEVAFDELFKDRVVLKPRGGGYELGPRFDGFSDHTLGVRQTKRAIEAGAKVIEKHVRLGYEDETCPDARFAVTIEELASVRA